MWMRDRKQSESSLFDYPSFMDNSELGQLKFKLKNLEVQRDWAQQQLDEARALKRNDATYPEYREHLAELRSALAAQVELCALKTPTDTEVYRRAVRAVKDAQGALDSYLFKLDPTVPDCIAVSASRED